MSIREAAIIALRALRASRLRSALTTVGIVIGVTAVIVLVGLGDGMKTGFNKNFGALATLITVDKVSGSIPGGGKPRDLKEGDVTALLEKAPDIATVTPVLSGKALVYSGPGLQVQGQVVGSTPDYLKVSNRELVRGQMFTSEQAKSRARVVVLGPELVTNLYGGDPDKAMGSQIRIQRNDFKVIGILKSQGSVDDSALMPLGTARAYLLGGSDTITTMLAKASGVTRVNPAVDQINQIMAERHNIKDMSKRDVTVTALQSQLEETNKFLGYLNWFVVAVAAISLLVGGIGVANIMLVSVTERTREIGIRKAIGARRSAIMKQFLIESTVLAGLGGVMGILFGTGITLAGAQIIPAVAPDFGAPELSPAAIAVAFAVSLAIGLIAGDYPAQRAARLRPIEALRFQ
ncbi:ABC transporter permease [Pseudonocardia eucalypti]|uniref:ABC transporter permease n=1 Tax=Pseudonocardia eucalypti TaxID=648755 RepID=A0ABP9R3S9_9PSEU|nr:putative ABC transport system permease protein [Pseudonocardia eucalypti]